jgi:hypothetical protein
MPDLPLGLILPILRVVAVGLDTTSTQIARPKTQKLAKQNQMLTHSILPKYLTDTDLHRLESQMA